MSVQEEKIERKGGPRKGICDKEEKNVSRPREGEPCRRWSLFLEKGTTKGQVADGQNMISGPRSREGEESSRSTK